MQESQIRLTDVEAEDAIEDAVFYVRKQLRTIPYGNVSVRFVVRDGAIITVKRTTEETVKPFASRHGDHYTDE